MKLYVECKECHRGFEFEASAPVCSCPSCGVSTEAEELWRSIGALSAAMGQMRKVFRFEVLLETDDLPAPHGFDGEYELPEGDAATIAAEDAAAVAKARGEDPDSR